MVEALVNDYVKAAPKYQLGATIESVMKEYGLTTVHKLGSNENQLGVSKKAMEAMMEACKTANFYPEGKGTELRIKLAEKLGVTPENIIITEGASVSLNLIGEMFLQEGDEIVYCEPTYGAYGGIVRRRKAVLKSVPLLPGMEMNFQGMLDAVTDKTKLVMVCNPNNPTGVACDDNTLAEFLKKLPEHVVAVVDEAYIQFVDDPDYKSMISEIADDKNLIVVQTFSKLYGMAGARVGYMVSNKEIISYFQRLANFFCTNKMALAGAIAALDDEEFAEATIKNNREGRAYITEELKAMGFEPYPSSTNFIYCDCKMEPFELAEELKKRGYIIRGNLGLSRISIGTMEQNIGLMKAMRAVLNK